ncbi:hypothetical protein B0H16DRAFT_1519288 [Mycena metata]|uniref:HMG box domain-containing protein n=1 Tax=Mycena metata TaxID=1033252 RepID=A0AAD7JMW6_9AGAR|nr:hypothetical protein B0H16DRAFT_1519288 [Mycena metata]
MGPPKTRFSAYMEFNSQWSKDHMDLPIGERGRRAAAVWYALSDAEKQAYTDTANAKKAVALIAYDKWMKESDPALLRQLNKQRAARGKARIVNHTLPKRPASAFIRFTNALRETAAPIPNMLEFSKECGVKWRALPDAEKEPYLKASQLAFAEWKKEETARKAASPHHPSP